MALVLQDGHRQTYEPISSIILNTDIAEVSFTSIPSNYTDLVCTVSGRYSGVSNMRIRFNSDSGSNYSYIILSGSTGMESLRGSNTGVTQADYYAALGTTNPGNAVINIFSYTNTNIFKPILMSSGSVDTAIHRNSGLWRSLSVVTSINFVNGGNNYKAGTVFNLYGIRSA